MPTATLTDIFDRLWTEHHAYLLDRQQTALLRCLRDEPSRVLALFDYFISQSLGRIAISDVAPPLVPTRYCHACGRENLRRHARLCKRCDDRRYRRQRTPRAV
jgi:hypothetical protein